MCTAIWEGRQAHQSHWSCGWCPCPELRALKEGSPAGPCSGACSVGARLLGQDGTWEGDDNGRDGRQLRPCPITEGSTCRQPEPGSRCGWVSMRWPRWGCGDVRQSRERGQILSVDSKIQPDALVGAQLTSVGCQPDLQLVCIHTGLGVVARVGRWLGVPW